MNRTSTIIVALALAATGAISTATAAPRPMLPPDADYICKDVRGRVVCIIGRQPVANRKRDPRPVYLYPLRPERQPGK
jgi:hypothetical protein